MPILHQLTEIYRRRGHEIVTGIPPRFSGLPFTEFTYIVTDEDVTTTLLGIAPQEIYFLEHLFQVYRPRTIFIVGNSFGWSTLALALLNPEAQVVAIEAGLDQLSESWIELTNRIAAEEGLNVQVVKGMSPQDVAAVVGASCSTPIDFMLVDGYHSNEQVELDFDALRPFTDEASVFLFHDVLFWNLGEGVRKVMDKSGLVAHLLWRTSSGMALLCHDAAQKKEMLQCLASFELGPKTVSLIQSLKKLGEAPSDPAE